MTIDRLNNAIRGAAQRANVSRAPVRIGTVTNYVFTPYPSVKVALQPDGTLTGYLPVTAQWVGNGWGMFGAPNIGDQCEVQFQEDGAGGGFVVGRFWNVNVQGMPVPSGEWWLIHGKGAAVKLTNDGKVLIQDSFGSNYVMNADGTGSQTFENGYQMNCDTNIVGNLNVTGNVTVGNGLSGNVPAGNGLTITFQDGICTNVY